MRLALVSLGSLLLSVGMASAEFALSFDWGDIPLCTNGYPNKVGNPEFTISGLPEGTTVIVFKLRDLDAPNADHGGGKIKMSQDGTVPRFEFTYKSPCPRDAVHTFEWRAIAKGMGEVLGVAKAQRPYPE